MNSTQRVTSTKIALFTYFRVLIAGQVPILDTGSKIITESLVICDYLEQEYPDPPLYPKNDAQKNSDKELISSYANMISIYYEALWNKDNKTFTEYVQNLKPYLERLQQELEKRGKYFGGESPGMADYMLWPWVERTDAISLVYEEKPFSHTVSNRLNKWCGAMRTQNAVTESQISTERYLKLIKLYRQGNFTDYDSV